MIDQRAHDERGKTFTIGGSEAAAAVGLDQYRSRVALWAEKTGLAEPREAGEAAQWGTLLQPLIAEQVETRGYVTMPAPSDAIVSDEYGWMRGHLDGYCAQDPDIQADAVNDAQFPQGGDEILVGRGVLEVKTCGPWIKGWDNDGAPPAYVCQVHHYMALTGLQWALLACLVAGQRLELRVIERDEALLAMIVEAEQEFVGLCEAGTPPAPDGSAATDEMLKRLYPKAHAGTVVALTAEDMVVVGEARALKAAVKETEKQLAEREQVLKMRLGDNELGVYEGAQVVSWKSVLQERKAQEARTVEYRRFLL